MMMQETRWRLTKQETRKTILVCFQTYDPFNWTAPSEKKVQTRHQRTMCDGEQKKKKCSSVYQNRK